MRLYFARHGIAERAAPGQPDRDRALTPEGTSRMRTQARVLAQGRFPVEHLFSSPYRRAHQTATLLGEALGVPVEVDALLASGCTFDDAAELVRRVIAKDHIMLVGHQPDLGYLVRLHTGAAVRMAPGSIAVVETPRLRPGYGHLRALLDPDWMVRIGQG